MLIIGKFCLKCTTDLLQHSFTKKEVVDGGFITGVCYTEPCSLGGGTIFGIMV